MQQYYDEVILPMVADRNTPAATKKIYKDIFRLLRKHKEKGEFCDNKAPRALCSQDLLSKVSRRIAKQFIAGAYNKKVVLITDSHCYSACVWSSKFLARMPNCVFIGKDVS